MSCHHGNRYAGGLPRIDRVRMGDFQVAMRGGVWVAVGDSFLAGVHHAVDGLTGNLGLIYLLSGVPQRRSVARV